MVQTDLFESLAPSPALSDRRLAMEIFKHAPDVSRDGLSVRTCGWLPARRIDSAGHTHIDQRAIFWLALPLMVSSAVQIVLGVTDMWFIGRISTQALAAVGAVQSLMNAILMVLGGGAMAVQAIVARSFGARCYVRAAKAVWTGLWATLCIAPLLIGIAASSAVILTPLKLNPEIETLASAFWFPRMAGSSLGIAGSAVLGYFCGIGQPRVTLLVTGVVAVVNALFNQFFIFHLGLGVAGSGWASTAAQGIGLLLAMATFLSRGYRRVYKPQLTWRLHVVDFWSQLRMGFTIGLLPAADMLAFWFFQVMQVRYDTVGGAATQMVAVLGSIASIPGLGLASAGMTLVGQSIGAGDRNWASRLGTYAILQTAVYMGGIGAILAFSGPWILPWFASGHDAVSGAVIALGTHLVWFNLGCQFFDGLYFGSSLCLRAAGDVTVPAALALPLAWAMFLPLAQSLTFPPGGGQFEFLPQFGLGTAGGWAAVLVYSTLIGSALFLRWQLGTWRKIRA